MIALLEYLYVDVGVRCSIRAILAGVSRKHAPSFPKSSCIGPQAVEQILMSCVKLVLWSHVKLRPAPNNKGVKNDLEVAIMEAQHVGFVGALRSFFQKFANFTGRSSRSEYWWIVLWDVIFAVLLGIITVFTKTDNLVGENPFNVLTSGNILAMVLEVIYLLYMFGNFSLTVRRFRDAGVNPYLSIITLIPFSRFMWYSMMNFGYYANAAVSVVSIAASLYMLYVVLRPSKD